MGYVMSLSIRPKKEGKAKCVRVPQSVPKLLAELASLRL
jgi:hypothetical protein